jgi:predicted nucleic acid-binding protein
VTALIFNTSPRSHFARAGRLALLDRLTAAYRRVVPQAVLDELRAGELAHPPLADLGNADWLEIVACDGLAELRAFAHYVRVLGAGERDIGEASVLAWAEVNGGIAVIDERAGTQAAQARGVTVHGTLWLIANGLNAGDLLLPEAERLVDQLRSTDARLPCSGAEFFEWAKAQGLLRL